MKRRIKSDLAWVEANISYPRISCVYGFRNGTNVHGHAVLSGSDIVYQRDISGANLIVFGSKLIISGANLDPISYV